MGSMQLANYYQFLAMSSKRRMNSDISIKMQRILTGKFVNEFFTCLRNMLGFFGLDINQYLLVVFAKEKEKWVKLSAGACQT